jgi:hypothetical protein
MPAMKMRGVGIFIFAVLFVGVMSVPQAFAQKTWRPATEAELSALLPDRAPVEKEHIETEMRTATGITNGNGTYIAAVLLITAGYSADGKYSHFLIVQSPMHVGGVKLKAGNYAVGFERQGDVLLNVHFHDAVTGVLVGSAEAHKLTGSSRVESFHIWPPSEKSFIQIGRFGIPYILD